SRRAPGPRSRLRGRGTRRDRRALVPFEGEAASAHPVGHGEPGRAAPGAQLRGRVSAVLGELLAQDDRASRDRVVAEHDLVLALEDVVADEVRLGHLEAELLAHLAHDGGLGVFLRLEEAGDEGEEALRPLAVAREDDLALVLDEGADRGRGIAPVHEAALRVRARQALAHSAVVGDATRRERRGAARTKAELHARATAAARPSPAP